MHVASISGVKDRGVARSSEVGVDLDLGQTSFRLLDNRLLCFINQNQ